MKLYITEFTLGDKTFSGPYIYAEDLEEASTEARIQGVVIVAEATLVEENEEEWNRVLH
tara:strand:- start:590 stop:766 length:177 start_codon:yes stop_codon:yes gene_type:complete